MARSPISSTAPRPPALQVDQREAHAAAERSRTEPTRFRRGANWITGKAGSPSAAVAVIASVIAWTVVGFLVDFPRWWELVLTAGVPVLTLLMFVVLQHTQNHDARATQLKLDELIRSSHSATNRMMTVEDASPDDLDRIREDFQHQAVSDDARYRHRRPS